MSTTTAAPCRPGLLLLFNPTAASAQGYSGGGLRPGIGKCRPLRRDECSPRARHLCCTTYAVPVPVSSARSDRHMPHRSPGFKHPLTNASPPLKRTRTASCAFHSSSASQSSWPPAHRAWESTAETTNVVWADNP